MAIIKEFYKVDKSVIEDKNQKQTKAFYIVDKGKKMFQINTIPDSQMSVPIEQIKSFSQTMLFDESGMKFLSEIIDSIISKSDSSIPKEAIEYSNLPLQQIFYGAPGTGKSHTIDDITKNESVIRTTFHPDSDYSTFVGAYKPTMGLLPICDELGQPMKIGETVLHKEQIVYEFVDQAFLQAYVQAWKNIIFYNGKKQYLVIEEINRGNCAQIFGDLFQLLDRNSAGFSDYPINADKDLQKYLKKVFDRMDEPNKQIFLKSVEKQRINSLYKGGEDIVCKVLSGEILLLPNNLYIWATMNTSDQSLFPIDSAFKRRWDWKYVPIKYSNTDWRIELGDKEYSWVSFQRIVNDKIKDVTDGSEDKLMGDFFVKAQHNDGKIDSDLLLNKIAFYLWNDVCKDGEGDIFKIKNGDKTEDISFSQFFNDDKTTYLQQWMDYLEVKPYTVEDDNIQKNIESAKDKIDECEFTNDTYKSIVSGICKNNWLSDNEKKFFKNGFDIKFTEMAISKARFVITLDSYRKQSEIKIYIPSPSGFNQSGNLYKFLKDETRIPNLSWISGESGVTIHELGDGDPNSNKVKGWAFKIEIDFTGDVAEISDKISDLSNQIFMKADSLISDFVKSTNK